jgi:NADH:ubiquinone oxidoreductase subunit F (NADH-binding)
MSNDATSTAARVLPDERVSSLQGWVDLGGGEGLQAAADRTPAQVRQVVSDAGLRGRGGAGFPTGTKWQSVVEAAREADSAPYLVANAAEGEPGTYKDRVIIDRNPFAFLEGVLIARYAIGADRAYIGIKEGFTHHVERLSDALDEMVAAGWHGADRVVIVPGPDEYLFGEESAMLEVIEERLPLPRILPPFQQGLFATTTDLHPTVVNNVETLSHVAHILAKGPAWFREVGTDRSPGSMVFTVVGDVDTPGVHELPLGQTLRTLLVDICGADPDHLLAVYSGTSNAVITPDMLDARLGFDEMTEVGSGMGSGGFVVYDDTACIVQVVAELSRFLAVESCGQCIACKLGTGAITDLLLQIDAGEATASDLDEIRKRCVYVTDQNRCYLPVGEQLMVGSTLDDYEQHFLDHLDGRGCPKDRKVLVPKIVNIDDDSGEVTYDERHARKQPDWSYADE